MRRAAAVVAFIALLGFAAVSDARHHPVRGALDAFQRNLLIAGSQAEVNPVTGARLDRMPAGHKCSRRTAIHPLGEQCANGEYCSGNETCCEGGASCCPVQTACCQDQCCSNTTDYKAESCCPDPKNGAVCCLQETTFCCPPNPDLDQPSRCCPRWYVCCAKGRFGCCDPDSGMSMEHHQRRLHESRLPALPSDGRHHRQQSSMRANGTNYTARAIFEENSIWTDESQLYGNNIDLITGAMDDRVELTPGVFHTEQEMTRVFAYSPDRDEFYIVQSNFTDPALDFPVTLYRLNSVTGAVTKQGVAGVRDEITGWYYGREQKTLLMSTKWRDATTNALIGYKFYHVDVDTAVATLVSSLRNPPGVDTYAGWFHEASADLKYLYRLGYQDLTTSMNFGLGITNISSANATLVKFIAIPAPPGNYDRYHSIHRVNGQHSDDGLAEPYNVTFISLAQEQNLTAYEDLGVFTWQPTPTGSAFVRKLTQLKNAHLTEYFGPIAEATDKTRTKYATMVVQLSPLGSEYNSWALATVDVLTGGANLQPISPSFLSSINSLSGFGIPDSSS